MKPELLEISGTLPNSDFWVSVTGYLNYDQH